MDFEVDELTTGSRIRLLLHIVVASLSAIRSTPGTNSETFHLWLRSKLLTSVMLGSTLIACISDELTSPLLVMGPRIPI
jgi:hypothetical protein